jgi:predicted HicB family RNase H-like nuclease
MTVEKKRKQIVWDVQPDLHLDIKIRAAKKGMSMNLWIMRAIYDQIKRENNERLQIKDEEWKEDTV